MRAQTLWRLNPLTRWTAARGGSCGGGGPPDRAALQFGHIEFENVTSSPQLQHFSDCVALFMIARALRVRVPHSSRSSGAVNPQRSPKSHVMAFPFLHKGRAHLSGRWVETVKARQNQIDKIRWMERKQEDGGLLTPCDLRPLSGCELCTLVSLRFHLNNLIRLPV